MSFPSILWKVTRADGMRVLIFGGGDGSEVISREAWGVWNSSVQPRRVGHGQGELCTCIFRELLGSSAAFPW